MARTVRIAVLAATMIALARAGAADGGPDGIAFAQAEEGTWWCQAADGTEASRCAVEKCTAESGGQECFNTRWCYPAGWSGLMITWLPEFHSTHVICGAPSGTAVRAALEATCGATEEFTRCDFVLLIDPDGNEREISDTWPGPAAAGSP